MSVLTEELSHFFVKILFLQESRGIKDIGFCCNVGRSLVFYFNSTNLRLFTPAACECDNRGSIQLSHDCNNVREANCIVLMQYFRTGIALFCFKSVSGQIRHFGGNRLLLQIQNISYALNFRIPGSTIFRMHEIFVQSLTAVDSLTCFVPFAYILFSYRSRRVRNIRK